MVHRKNDIDKESDLLLRADPAFFQEIRDVLSHMRKQESGIYNLSSTKLPDPFNGAWRKQIVEWMYILVKHCKLRHEAAAGGAYFLDAAVTKGVITSPEDYQLGALASLYLGLKVFDSPGTRVVRLSSLVKLGNADFAEDDIVRMERSIVLALGWHLNPPTANCFLQQYLCLLPISGENLKNNVEDRAFTIIEKSLANDRLRDIKSSQLGFSALIMGIDGYLKDQKNVATDKDDERITVEQLRSFFYNMNTVAGLDYRDTTVNHWMAHVMRATSDRLSSTTTTTSTFNLNHDQEKVPRGNTTEAVRGTTTEKGGLGEEETGHKSDGFLSMTMSTHHSPTNVMLQ